MTSRLAIVLLLLVPVLGVAEDKPKRAWLGLMIGPDKDSGAIVVLQVIADGPAQKAGLKANDLLIRIDGAKPATVQAAVKVIMALKPGKKVKLEVLRDGKKKVIEAVPDELKE